MNDLNVFMAIGRLTRDPELRYTPNGKATTKFGLAVNKSYRKADGEEVKTPLFINVTTWGKVAENVANFLHKGSKIAVNGSLQSNNWEDQNGNKRMSFEITAHIVQFLDSKPQQPQQEKTSQPVQKENQSVTEVAQPQDDDVQYGDEVPF